MRLGTRPKNPTHSAFHIPLICLGASENTFKAAEKIYAMHPPINQDETEYIGLKNHYGGVEGWKYPTFKTYSAYASGLTNKSFEGQATYSQALSHFSFKKITEIDAAQKILYAIDETSPENANKHIEDRAYSYDHLVIDACLSDDTQDNHRSIKGFTLLKKGRFPNICTPLTNYH